MSIFRISKSTLALAVLATSLIVAGVSLAVWFAPHATAQQARPQRVARGLLVLYDFSERDDASVPDRSNFGEAFPLVIQDVSKVQSKATGLVLKSPTLIASKGPSSKIIEALRRSNSLSAEVWLTPANTSQAGPARILSLSNSPNARNFTLGQERDALDARLRSTATSDNGIPSLGSPARTVSPRRMHIVYTRDPSGAAVLYVDGRVVAQKKVQGKLDNWNSTYRLLVANELTGDRPWIGELHLAAMYDRALTLAEVRQNFAAGVERRPPPTDEMLAARAFERQIAPMLSQHCLECHDSAIRKGGLNLSRRDAAMMGGDSGKVIVPGNPDESLLWQAIESNEMPKDRAPLSQEEKQAVRQWIEQGATWSVDPIDPAVYLHEGHAGEIWVQRLTLPEYVETVKQSLGVDVSKEANELLPRDLRADGFRNTAYNLNIDLKHVEAYRQLAEIIVGRIDIPKFAARFSKNRTLDADKLDKLVAAMGRGILRGPLSQHEINIYQGIATSVTSAGGDYDDAVRYMLQAMLQSPRFLYRIEDHRGGGVRRPVGPYELASRLSYILWGGPPDEELLDAAERGDLADRAKVEAQVRRMVQNPRTIERSKQFIAEWLNLDHLNNLRPDETRFPNWNAELAADMQRETLAFFEEVAWRQNRPLADLLNAEVTFVTPELARHYGLEPKGKAGSLERHDLTAIPSRGGLLTHGSVLTLGGDDASMVTRGLFVLHDLLRGTVNAPPPCVDTTPPPTKTGLTQRGIAEARIANEKCGVCHARFEPLAFGLEQFDGVGGFHQRDEHGNTLREDGEILFPGDAEPIAYKTSAELMDLLAGSERVRESITWKLTQFALGRPLLAADAPLIREIHQNAQEGGGTYSALITAIVLSDLVQKTRTEREL